MRNFIKAIMIITLAVFVLTPLAFVIFYYLDLPNYLQFVITLFHEIYFNLLFGILVLALFLLNANRIVAGGKKLEGRDYIWFAIIPLLLFLFVAAYTAEGDSIFLRMDSVFPALGLLAPDLRSFTLWNTLSLLISSGFILFHILARAGFDKPKTGALIQSLLIAMTLSVFLVKVPFMAGLEEFFTALRFTWLRNPGTKEHTPGLPYCQAPYDASGQKMTAMAPNPPGVRDNIEIVGISNKTIEELKGNWPLDWQIYANVARRFENADNSILLFDISFLDEKGVYGGNYCGLKFECNPIGTSPIRRQVDILSDTFHSLPKPSILSDYPMETTDEARSSIVNYESRMAILNRKERLLNVKNGAYAQLWAKLPVPPVEQVAANLDGIGYANVLKNEQGMNRFMPIVIRIKNMERAQAPDYNPDTDDYFYPGIDLVVASRYYGIDMQKDVEVDWLKGYVRLNNIPEKTYQKMNLEAFEMETKDVMAKPPEAGAARSITIPINRTGLMNINFRGGRYCFKFNELLEVSEMDPVQSSAFFTNKIALVAMYYATGVGTAKDIHLSPYGDMAGIEHHAYALSTILNQDFMSDASPWVNLLILILVAAIMGLYQPRVQTLFSFILALFIAALFAIFTLFVSFDYYSYIHVFPTVIIEQLLIFIGFIGLRVLTEEENVKFIRNTFSKFVSQDVVNELLNNPDAIALGGAKKEVSVFFSDVRGFTTISEALGPEELVHLLNEYLSEMTELIIDYRGTIDKYMGDAIMAFWGAPAKNDDHAYYACVAALSQYRALQTLQKRWSERDIPVLDIGIGINTGPAVVGNMGSSRRMDYTLMGDTVNLGSRLEGITKQYGVKICISEFTYERVKERVFARELDLVRVKGKLKPVRIYELMGLKDEGDIERLKVSSVQPSHKK
jgi:adenylate cyclase